MTTVLILILILLLVGAFPAWEHSQAYGLIPSGVIGLLLALVIVLLLTGRI
jgi:hypothetical protein